MSRRATVTQAYRSAFPDPLRAVAGERLAWERRESEWPGWVWCTTSSGVSGWVPESWTRAEKGAHCALLRDYDATELTVEPGQAVQVESSESGWALARDDDGTRGWIPLSHLRFGG